MPPKRNSAPKSRPRLELGNDLHIQKLKSNSKNSYHCLNEVRNQIEAVAIPYNKMKLLEIYNKITPFIEKYQHMELSMLFDNTFRKDLLPIMRLMGQQSAGKKLFLHYEGDIYCGLTKYVYWYFSMPTNLADGTLALIKQHASDLEYQIENPPKNIAIQCSISDQPLQSPSVELAVDSSDITCGDDTIHTVDAESDVVTVGITKLDLNATANTSQDSGNGTLDNSNSFTVIDASSAVSNSTPKQPPVINIDVSPVVLPDDGFDSSEDDSTDKAICEVTRQIQIRERLQQRPPPLGQIGRQDAVADATIEDDAASNTSWEEIPDVPPLAEFHPLNPENDY